MCDLLVVAFTRERAVLWTRHICATEKRFVAESMDVDRHGAVIVCGDGIGTICIDGHTFAGDADKEDGFVIKLNAVGDLEWAKRLESRGQTQMRGCAVSHVGDIAVSGLFFQEMTLKEVVLRAEGGAGFVCVLSSAGDIRWGASFDGRQGAQGGWLAFGPSGALYATALHRGQTSVGDSTPGDAKTSISKFCTNGEVVWSRYFGNSVFSSSIALDDAENILWSGYFLGDVDVGSGRLHSMGGYDILLAKLSSQGVSLWSHAFGDHRQQFLARCAFTSSGQALLAGSFHGTIRLGNETYTATGCTVDGSDEGDEDGFIAILEP
jgi:hypothetical protein